MDSTTGKLLEEARALLRNGALNDVAERCAAILRSDPANADALYFLAQVNCRQDRLERRHCARPPRRCDRPQACARA